MSVFALVAFFAVISGTQITSANFYSDVCSRYKNYILIFYIISILQHLTKMVWNNTRTNLRIN